MSLSKEDRALITRLTLLLVCGMIYSIRLAKSASTKPKESALTSTHADALRLAELILLGEKESENAAKNTADSA